MMEPSSPADKSFLPEKASPADKSFVPEKLSKWAADIKWDEETLYCYIGIEVCWHICLFSACYRLRPISWMQSKPWGNAIFKKFGQKGETFFASPWKRTISEWFLLNKVVGIPLLPAKIALGASISRHFSQSHAPDPQ